MAIKREIKDEHDLTYVVAHAIQYHGLAGDLRTADGMTETAKDVVAICKKYYEGKEVRRSE